MTDNPRKYTSMRVLSTTAKRLKVLAAIKGVSVLALIDRLSKEEFKRLNEGKDQKNGE